MIREAQNIVCLSTIDWDFVWQGHQEIMSTLAREGHRVLFIENTGVRNVTLQDLPRLRNRLLNWRSGTRGIRKVMDNVYVYAPLVLPFPYSSVAQAVNRGLMHWTLRSWIASMRFDSPIIWTWLPTALTLELIRTLDAQLVVYYCCDDFQASSSGSRRIRETEDVLLRKADLVFAHSKAIFDRCRRFTDQVHVFQYGFNRDIFMRSQGPMPADLALIAHPIIGYIGGVHKHVDQVLLEKVVTAHPDKSLVLVGPLQTEADRLAKQPNVHFLGQKPYEELPAYIRQFDVCVIPYELNEYTRSVYPTKLNEYLIMGKPVVSTKLSEVEYFNQCHQGIVAVAEGREAFVRRIGEELRAGSPDDGRAMGGREVRRCSDATYGLDSVVGAGSGRGDSQSELRRGPPPRPGDADPSDLCRRGPRKAG
ncbi:MAG: glycosyltransferase family 1 protein [Nitrospirae bacterium]|nr:MAG: glycosyltransferase family 1 protein [Nitrospirota bacterium]